MATKPETINISWPLVNAKETLSFLLRSPLEYKVFTGVIQVSNQRLHIHPLCSFLMSHLFVTGDIELSTGKHTLLIHVRPYYYYITIKGGPVHCHNPVAHWWALLALAELRILEHFPLRLTLHNVPTRMS